MVYGLLEFVEEGVVVLEGLDVFEVGLFLFLVVFQLGVHLALLLYHLFAGFIFAAADCGLDDLQGSFGFIPALH